MKTFYIASLGCAKNLVDSELMTGRLIATGWTLSYDPAHANVLIVNTCGFIENAANESIDKLLELSEIKKKNKDVRLIAAGCLVERYKNKISSLLPEADCFLGTGALGLIVKAAQNKNFKSFFPDPNFAITQKAVEPRALSRRWTAYLKIAEGCSRRCTYCIIPKIRGRYKSRPPEDIIKEAETLIDMGVKEITLVSQETTRYGNDLPRKYDLSSLLKELAEKAGHNWVRFMYGHPESIDKKLIDTMASYNSICSYFDMPIQHASDNILKKMGRKYTGDDLLNMLDVIKNKGKNVVRTTVITGFPGETDKDFSILLNFVKKARFNHLGVFIYSDAKDLSSSRLSDHVPKKAAKQRHDELMTVQQKISLEKNRNYIGKKIKLLAEEPYEPGIFLCRSEFQAPEVDGKTYIRHKGNIKVGDFVSAKITDASEYDLYASYNEQPYKRKNT